MSVEQQFCTFCVDGLFFGVEVLKVQEVIRYQAMTPVPLAPAVVNGLINLRGQIVTAIDLRRALGLSDRPAGSLPMNVVVRTDDGVVSLLVDGLVRRRHEVTLFASGDSRTEASLVSTFPDARSDDLGLTQPELLHALTCVRDAHAFDVVSDHTGALGLEK